MNSPHLTRRHFLAALAASVVAAGAALPIGFPAEFKELKITTPREMRWIQLVGDGSQQLLLTYTGKRDEEATARHAA